MKKLILMMLVLVCGVTQMKADIVVYVQADSAPYIWAWETGNTSNNYTGGVWDSRPQMTAVTLWGETYYKWEKDGISGMTFLLSNVIGGTNNQTSDIVLSEAGEYYFTYNGYTEYANVTNSTIVSHNVCLPGSHNGWKGEESIFTESEGTYTYTLITPNTNGEYNDGLSFKLLDHDVWLGFDEITIEAPSGWVYRGSGNNNDNIELNNQGYISFNLTAKKDASNNWTLKIEGKDASPFTIVGDAAIVNGTGWDANETANAMTDEDGDGIFYLLVENVNLNQGTYYYKVYRNHNAQGWQVPANGNNDYYVGEGGIYNIIYKLVAHTYTLTMELIPANVDVTFNTNAAFATFSSDYAVDFGQVSQIKAYQATLDGSKVKLVGISNNSNKKVPANTGLILHGVSGLVPTTLYTSDAEFSDNLLKAGTGAEVNSDDNTYRYSFVKRGNDYGFVKITEAKTIAKGKAYLEIPAGQAPQAASLGFYFDDEPTAIYTINADDNSVENSAVYNLAGQRVAEPSKGLYIVNGKKFIK